MQHAQKYNPTHISQQNNIFSTNVCSRNIVLACCLRLYNDIAVFRRQRGQKMINLDDIAYTFRSALIGNAQRCKCTMVWLVISVVLAIVVPKTDALFISIWIFNIIITTLLLHKIHVLKNR